MSITTLDFVSIFTAFNMGFLGSLHCVGMCGGIISMLSLGLAKDIQTQPKTRMGYLLAYNGGRILSYTIAGVLLALFGKQLMSVFPNPQETGRYFAIVFMMLLGMYIANWWSGLVYLEKAGSHLWKHIEPLGRRFLPVKSYPHAFLVGGIWGWLPCGMVYAALALTIAVADPVQGAAVMVAFGLGTLPMLLLMGTLAEKVNHWRQKAWLRQAAGLSIIAMALWLLVMPPMHHGHGHGQHGEHSGHTEMMDEKTSDMQPKTMDPEHAEHQHHQH